MNHIKSFDPYYPYGHPLRRGETTVVNDDESDKPNCARCPKFENGGCLILGEPTAQALSLCASAGYWDCFKPRRRDDGPYRHSAHTGARAEALEKR